MFNQITINNKKTTVERRIVAHLVVSTLRIMRFVNFFTYISNTGKN